MSHIGAHVVGTKFLGYDQMALRGKMSKLFESKKSPR